MSRNNYIPVRFSDRELEQIKDIGKQAGVDNTSASIRYAIAYANNGLVRQEGYLKPGETVVILPEKLVTKLEGLKKMENVDNLEDKIKVLIEFWEKV